MRGSVRTGLAATLLLTGTVAAVAEPGSFFKNLFAGSGAGSSADAPGVAAPKALDPDEVHCPAVTVADGSAALQSFAGTVGDNTRLRHQIVFGRFSRECAPRDGGAVAVKVGVQLRALLGPAGAPGRFEAPLTIALKYNDKVLVTRSRRVAITVPSDAAQGTAAVIESDLIVPADMAVGYDIEIALGSPSAKAPKVAGRRRKPAVEEATAGAAKVEVPPLAQ